MKYRKKPVVIDAFKWEGQSYTLWPEWASEYTHGHQDFQIRHEQDGTLSIPTLEGRMTAQRGDFIIKGVKGEVYPCKPDIFEATYEKV